MKQVADIAAISYTVGPRKPNMRSFTSCRVTFHFIYPLLYPNFVKHDIVSLLRWV